MVAGYQLSITKVQTKALWTTRDVQVEICSDYWFVMDVLLLSSSANMHLLFHGGKTHPIISKPHLAEEKFRQFISLPHIIALEQEVRAAASICLQMVCEATLTSTRHRQKQIAFCYHVFITQLLVYISCMGFWWGLGPAVKLHSTTWPSGDRGGHFLGGKSLSYEPGDTVSCN